MLKPVARLVVRRCDKKDGLILGVLLKPGKPFLKPNTVYEIQEFDGELIIKKVGPSFLTKKAWGSAYEDLMERHGKYFFLSKKEYVECCKKPDCDSNQEEA